MGAIDTPRRSAKHLANTAAVAAVPSKTRQQESEALESPPWAYTSLAIHAKQLGMEGLVPPDCLQVASRSEDTAHSQPFISRLQQYTFLS